VILSTICSEALWLEMGERRAFGSASDVLHCYLIAANHAAT
jgi:ABC-type polysaccharide/polyol phosphate transport system ATPase subunit